MVGYKDCLACANSFSTDSENGEHILFCVINERIVDEEELCDEFNN